jgi:opacity protein-like surface antigen
VLHGAIGSPRATTSVVGTLLCALTLTATFAASAYATEDEPELRFARPGLYVGVSGAIGVTTRLSGPLDDYIEVTEFVNPPQQNTRGLFNIEVEPSLGLDVHAGYRVHPRVAVELHYEWMNNFNVNFDNAQRTQPNVSSDIGEIETSTLTGDVKGYVLTGRIQPFAAVGLGAIWVDSKNTSETTPLGQPNGRPIVVLNISDQNDVAFAARFGAGVDIYVADHVAMVLGASYVLPTDSAENFDYVSTELGLQFRF